GLGSIENWRAFPDMLADDLGLGAFAYDRLGYGRSEGRDPWPDDFMAQSGKRLPLVLGAAEIDDFILVGHSDGATIALLFAAQYHDRALSSVIEAPHVFAETVTIEGVATLTERYQRDATLQSKLARIHTDPDGAFYAWSTPWLSSQFRTWSIADQLSRLRSPLLVIQGANDPFGSIAHAELIAGAAEKYTTVAELPGCGHNPHREEPATTIQLAAEFLMHDH
ncbi:MAG: alpha/beta hydrolase, partial [Nevskia sp.]|nr:alpha/beta hydrolase [Nevskia sp.]